MEEKRIKEYPIDFNLINEIDTQYYQVKRTKATIKTTIMVKKEDYDNLQQQLQIAKEEKRELNTIIDKLLFVSGENQCAVLPEDFEEAYENIESKITKLNEIKSENTDLTQQNKEMLDRLKCRCFDSKSKENRCTSFRRMAEDYERDLKKLKVAEKSMKEYVNHSAKWLCTKECKIKCVSSCWVNKFKEVLKEFKEGKSLINRK